MQMQKRGKSEMRVDVTFRDDLWEEVELWRASQRPIPSSGAAVRILVWHGLRAETRNSTVPNKKNGETEKVQISGKPQKGQSNTS